MNRIYSAKKRKEIQDILDEPHPAHHERVFVAGFLRYAVGLSVEETCALIKTNCAWRDFKPAKTQKQVVSVKKQTRTESQMKKEAFTDNQGGLMGGRSPPLLTGRSPVSFSSPCKPPGRKWHGVRGPHGFTLEWRRER